MRNPFKRSKPEPAPEPEPEQLFANTVVETEPNLDVNEVLDRVLERARTRKFNDTYGPN